MQFLEVVRKALETKTMTPVLEQQLDELFWSQEFNNSEMAALSILIEALADGTIRSLEEAQAPAN